MNCPFVYADGKKCTGDIYRARIYGAYGEIRKVRLWCSVKDDHAGAVRSIEGKLRMEFYPAELKRRGIFDAVLAMCESEP